MRLLETDVPQTAARDVVIGRPISHQKKAYDVIAGLLLLVYFISILCVSLFAWQGLILSSSYVFIDRV